VIPDRKKNKSDNTQFTKSWAFNDIANFMDSSSNGLKDNQQNKRKFSNKEFIKGFLNLNIDK